MVRPKDDGEGGTQTQDSEEGEQLQLLDVDLPEAKAIKRNARAYKKAQRVRITALAEEIKAKEKLIAVVKEAQASNKQIKPDEDGVVKFIVDGMTISVTPRDELVKVKFAEGDDDDD